MFTLVPETLVVKERMLDWELVGRERTRRDVEPAPGRWPLGLTRGRSLRALEQETCK